MSRFALIFCLFLFPAMGRAATLCPWINATTAFAALGSSPEDPSAKSAVTTNTCTFTYQASSVVRELHVTVDQSTDAQKGFAERKAKCTLNTKLLRTIGNEAVACAISSDAGARGERIIGRVRDQIFTVTITEKIADPAAASKDIPQTTEMVAELVAGNLF